MVLSTSFVFLATGSPSTSPGDLELVLLLLSIFSILIFEIIDTRISSVAIFKLFTISLNPNTLEGTTNKRVKRQKITMNPSNQTAPRLQKIEIHIEICQRSQSGVSQKEIEEAVLNVLQESSHLTEGPIAFERHHRDLAKHVASIRICELPDLSSIESTPDSMDIEDMNNNTTTTSSSSTTTPLGALDLQDVSIPFWKCACKLHVYKLDSDGPSQEFTGGGDTNDEDGISSLEQW